MPKTTATVDTVSKSIQSPPGIAYRLSEKSYLDSGWTARPCPQQNVHVVVTMKAKFSKSIISPWFKPRQNMCLGRYSDGRILFSARKNGTGKIYYPNGKLAIKIEKSGKGKEDTRVWAFHSGEVEKDGKRSQPKICGLFDSLGNGVIYDRFMEKNLVYNQVEGYLKKENNTYVKWKWHDMGYHNSTASLTGVVNPLETLQSFQFDNAFSPFKELQTLEKKCSNSCSSESQIEVEKKLIKSEENFHEALEHIKYLNTGKVNYRKVTPIKPIVLQLNKNLALRIISQAEISLSFFAKGRQTCLNLGVLYNPYDALNVTNLVKVPECDEVICSYECFPATTRSLVKLKTLLEQMKEKPSKN